MLKLLLDGDVDNEEDDGSDGSFHYPERSQSPQTRSSSSDYFPRPSSSRSGTDLTSFLFQAPDFRVPTHESPQNIPIFHSMPIPHLIDVHWERDEAVTVCRGCSRRFTFLFRKVCTSVS